MFFRVISHWLFYNDNMIAINGGKEKTNYVFNIRSSSLSQTYVHSALAGYLAYKY